MPSTPRFSQRTYWTTFLHDLAVQLEQPAVVTHRNRVLLWHGSNDRLDCLQLLPWCWPSREYPRAPRVTRISLNRHRYDVSQRDLRQLGLDRPRRSTEPLRLELSVLGDELLDFARWLPLWIRGRLDPSVLIPVPPLPCHIWSRGLRTMDYAWTVTALEAHARFHGCEPWLHPCATPASEVTPALPLEAGAHGANA